MVVCVLSFMNARDAATAGIFGSLGVIGLAWIVRKTKQRPQDYQVRGVVGFLAFSRHDNGIRDTVSPRTDTALRIRLGRATRLRPLETHRTTGVNGNRPGLLLAVGVYNGWTLLIDVIASQREEVAAFIERVRNHASNQTPTSVQT